MDILIKNGSVLIFEGQDSRIVKANIAIEEGVIKSVGEAPKGFSPEKTVDAGGMLVMPGLVNSHTHLPMSLLRNYADDMPLWDWLTKKVWPVEENMNEEDIYYGSLLSIAELIMSGTTCFNDMYRFADVIAQAAADTGIRGAVSNTLFDRTREEDFGLERAEKIYKSWHGKSNGRISTFIAPHAPYTCCDDYLREASQKAVELGVPIHIHLSESRDEVEQSVQDTGKTPVERLLDIGFFEAKTLAAHCVHVDKNDIEILARSGVSVLNNPTSNLKLANGFAPVSRLISSGVNVSLGTDGACSNNNQDMFEEINLAALVNKGIDENPLSVPSSTAVRMATINGARSMGIDAYTGSIEAGKRADIIIIDTDKPHFYPKLNLISSLSYCTKSSDVDTVIVDGAVLMEGRRLLGIDIEMVRSKVEESVKRLIG